MLAGIIAVHPFIGSSGETPPPDDTAALIGVAHFFGSGGEYSIGGLAEGAIPYTLHVYDAATESFTDIYQRYRIASDGWEVGGFMPRAIDGDYCISMEVNAWGPAKSVAITPYRKNVDLKVEGTWPSSETLHVGTDIELIDCYPFDSDNVWKPRDIIMLAKGRFLVMPLANQSAYSLPLSIVTYTGPDSFTHDNPVHSLADLGYESVSIRASGMSSYEQISVAVRLNEPVVAFRIPVSTDVGDEYLLALYDTDTMEFVSHSITADASVSPLSLFTGAVDAMTLHHDYTHAYYTKSRASAGGVRTGDEAINSNYGAIIGYQTFSGRVIDGSGYLSYEDLATVTASPQEKLGARITALGFTKISEYEPSFGLSGMFIS